MLNYCNFLKEQVGQIRTYLYYCKVLDCIASFTKYTYVNLPTRCQPYFYPHLTLCQSLACH
ncbi:unnamed protein product [Moneuplotes crassus]|uniref:Uncharacterized protein n=1 Tax=Euplotes crassus TaxID=5936 RepID=A0AAD1XR60_EUPCR|nr:unnamed protein product [Moneuplotes crassus]